MRAAAVLEALVTAVLQRAAEIGAHRVVLYSTEEMRVAHRLYAPLGFTQLPEWDWPHCLALGVTTA